MKSENAALQTAATIFVKFASQTGIIVSEQLMREHFSAFGHILDATIRTITIDEVRHYLWCVQRNSSSQSYLHLSLILRHIIAPRDMVS